MTEGKVLTAAERRAARRAKVLRGGEDRMKFLTGEVASLKPKTEEQEIEEQLADAAEELTKNTKPEVDEEEVENEADTTESNELDMIFPSRVDPVQRRRDAAARRKRKEAKIQELLASTEPIAKEKSTDASTAESTKKVEEAESVLSQKTLARSSEISMKKVSLALRLSTIEENFIWLLTILTALLLALNVSLKGVATGNGYNIYPRLQSGEHDEILLSYQQLISEGATTASIRDQMDRERLEKSIIDQIEALLFERRHAIGSSFQVSKANYGFFDSFLDLPVFFSTLLSHPPVFLCVVLLRVLIGFIIKSIQYILSLPIVKRPQDESLGMLPNLLLANRETLKGHIVQLRKSFDDVLLFLYVFGVILALRIIFLEH